MPEAVQIGPLTHFHTWIVRAVFGSGAHGRPSSPL
jgi:hypothetical protein